MTEAEFSEAVGRVFQAEWRKAQFWARVKYFTWGMVASSAIWILARLI